MILTGIINFVYFAISSIINLLPISTGFPADAHTAMAGLGGYMGVWGPILPLTTLLTCITIVFGVEIAIFGFKTGKWIISHLPWIGGKGN